MKTPQEALDALDRADRQAKLIENDPNGYWDTLRHAHGIFAPRGETWDMKPVWIPGTRDQDWQAQALNVQAAQMAQEAQNSAGHPAIQDSDHSFGIFHRPIIRRS